jgi:acyl-lipid omega-6 desaturase (Delta-12 desaturase)
MVKLKAINSAHQLEGLANILYPYTKKSNVKACIQVLSAMGSYFFFWIVCVWIISNPVIYWTVIPATILASLFLVRVFMLFHDCVHHSLFNSKLVNKYVGYLLGVLVFTSYESWRSNHLLHHESFSNLDKRGYGDLWMMTLDEYKTASKRVRLYYRIYRNPIVLFLCGAVINFMVINRFPERHMGRQERASIYVTNVLLIIYIAVAFYFIGIRAFLTIQLLIMLLSGGVGIWLFYIQHNFNGIYWARNDSWDRFRASMEGCSYYSLPRLFKWFTANIGFHHIHHLAPGIPNYNLCHCFNEIKELQNVNTITIRNSISSVSLKLWDEKSEKMVGFP